MKVRLALAWGLLALLVFAAYLGVRDNGFVSFDDDVYVARNPDVLAGLSLDGVAWAFRSTQAANWHPLTWLSHMLDVELFGRDAGAHHLVAVGLHALNAGLLLTFLARTTGALGPSLVVAALFALHPQRVESVAWVSERKDLLGGFFWMATLLAYARYARRPSLLRHAGVTLAFGLGLMAKPMLVTLPFVLLLVDLWPLGRWRLAGARPTAAPGVEAVPLRRLVLEKLPWFALAAASSVLTAVVQAAGGAVSTDEHVPLAWRVSNAVESWAAYVRTTLWPVDLSYFVPHPRLAAGATDPFRPETVLAAIVLALVTTCALASFRRRRYVAVGWFWFVGTLVPVIGLVQVGMQARADRYTYLPIIGLLVALVFLVESRLAGRTARRLGALAAAAAALLCVGATRAQVEVWADSESLYRHAVELEETNYVAHHHLGLALADDRRHDEARTHFERALELRPRHVASRVALGDTFLAQGRARPAAEAYQDALKLAPGNVDALAGLGSALLRTGELAGAEAALRAALSFDPDHPGVHTDLGLALARQERFEEAEPHLVRAVELRPRSVEARSNLGSLYARWGVFRRARDVFVELLELDPDALDARWSLVLSLIELGNLDRAAQELERALAAGEPPSAERREPGYVAHTLADLAEALREAGRTSESAAWLRRAVELAPPELAARLARRLAALEEGS